MKGLLAMLTNEATEVETENVSVSSYGQLESESNSDWVAWSAWVAWEAWVAWQAD